MTYDPDRSDIPYDPSPGGEVQSAAFMDPTPVKKGDRVLYRHDHHGDVTDALVVAIEHDMPEHIVANGVVVPIPPWPTLTLETINGRVRTRESRVRGSAGWLPSTWVDA